MVSDHPLLGLELPSDLSRPLVARGIPGRDLGQQGQRRTGYVLAEARNTGDGDVLAGPHIDEFGCLMVGAGNRDLVLPELSQRDVDQFTATVARQTRRLAD